MMNLDDYRNTDESARRLEYCLSDSELRHFVLTMVLMHDYTVFTLQFEIEKLKKELKELRESLAG